VPGRTKVSPSSPITGLEPDPRRAGAVRILIEGRAVLTVPVEVARAEGLRPGQVPGAEIMARLERAADHEAAFRTAVRLLERRPFARVDLARRLQLKGHLPEPVTVALDRAAQAGYLDDVRFARHYVESRSARGRGPARLRIELMRMGVERTLIDSALAMEGADEALDRQVDRLLAKRLPSVDGLPAGTARQRLLAYLARRGFRGDGVRQKVVAATAGFPPGSGRSPGRLGRGQGFRRRPARDLDPDQG
jgi:regulatory protein